jgi:hypothetical protein
VRVRPCGSAAQLHDCVAWRRVSGWGLACSRRAFALHAPGNARARTDICTVQFLRTGTRCHCVVGANCIFTRRGNACLDACVGAVPGVGVGVFFLFGGGGMSPFVVPLVCGARRPGVLLRAWQSSLAHLGWCSPACAQVHDDLAFRLASGPNDRGDCRGCKATIQLLDPDKTEVPAGGAPLTHATAPALLGAWLPSRDQESCSAWQLHLIWFQRCRATLAPQGCPPPPAVERCSCAANGCRMGGWAATRCPGFGRGRLWWVLAAACQCGLRGCAAMPLWNGAF